VFAAKSDKTSSRSIGIVPAFDIEELSTWLLTEKADVLVTLRSLFQKILSDNEEVHID
jgi:hypothetical protein